MQVLGKTLRWSGFAASTFIHGAISPAPQGLLSISLPNSSYTGALCYLCLCLGSFSACVVYTHGCGRSPIRQAQLMAVFLITLFFKTGSLREPRTHCFLLDLLASLPLGLSLPALGLQKCCYA